MDKPTEVAALLLCPLHLQLFVDPVLCPCGHTFCRSCILAEIASTGKCPVDGTLLQAKQLFPNQILAEEVLAYQRNGGAFSPAPKPVHCSFAQYGCEWHGPAEALSTHLSNCDYEKMKDFILNKERESSLLREEVRSKEQQIAELRQMLAANSPLQVELQRLLQRALALAMLGKGAIERGVGQIAGSISQGWSKVTDQQAYRDLSLSLEQTAERCAISVKNVLTTIQQASNQITDSELLVKLLSQTAEWKMKLSRTLEEVRETFARISIVPSIEAGEEEAALREATRQSLRSYLDEVQRLNEEHEQEQTSLVEGVLASLPPPPSLPIPQPPSIVSSASSSSGSATSTSGSSTCLDSQADENEENDGFVDIARRPLPPLPSAQLRK